MQAREDAPNHEIKYLLREHPIFTALALVGCGNIDKAYKRGVNKCLADAQMVKLWLSFLLGE